MVKIKKRKYDFLIFGAGGMQGKIVIKDLLEKGYKLFVSDVYQSHIDELKKKFSNIDYEILDLRNIKGTSDLIKRVKPFLVINCAEGDWNLNVYRACLKNRAHIIDLGSDDGFMTKKQLDMDSVFRKRKLTAITG